MGWVRALRDDLLSLALADPVAPGQRLSLSPSPDAAVLPFAIKGVVCACTGAGEAAAGGWLVELRLDAPSPGDLEILGAALEAQSSSRK